MHSIILCSLLILFLATRLYNFSNRLGFDHDQEKAAEAAWGIIVERQPSLIGIETSTGGVFAGPLLNWSHAVFMYLFKLDPVSLGYQAIFFSALAILLLFKLVYKIYGIKPALLAALTYIISARLIAYDISASPISYITFLSILTIYLTYETVYVKKHHLLPLLAFVLTLGYHVHLTLLLQIPAVLLILLYRKARFTKRQAILSMIAFVIPLLSYFAFELRHNLLMTGNLISLVSKGDRTDQFKFIDTITNFITVEAETIIPATYSYLFIFLMVAAYFRLRAHINKTFLTETLIFLTMPLVCLLLYQGHIPDYYFLVATPAAIILASNLFFSISKKLHHLVLAFLIFAIFVNFQSSIFYLHNPFSINLKKSVVEYIKEESQGKDISLYYEIPTSLNYGFEYLLKWSKVTFNNESQNIYVIDYSTPQEFSSAKYEKEGRTVEIKSFEPFHVVSIK